jgi:hypothetical protein
MSKKVLITGVSIQKQKRQAEKILRTQVIPKEKSFQEKKNSGNLSRDLLIALKNNA